MRPEGWDFERGDKLHPNQLGGPPRADLQPPNVFPVFNMLQVTSATFQTDF